MKSFLWSVVIAGLSGLLCASGLAAQVPDPVTSTTRGCDGTEGSVAVSGKQILRDGKPWIAHGYYQIAFEVPPGELPHELPFWTVASENYTPAEYTQMRQVGADSVRVQVAQDGMDPQGSFFSPEYRDRVIGAIQAARAAGLTVIVSVQNEPQTGAPDTPTDLPSHATERVWRELTPVFGQDCGVLFELFNEPHIGRKLVYPVPDADWQTWAAGMNDMIHLVRALGAVNAVVVDGMDYAEELSGAPPLDDPLHQVIYGAHPYAHNQADQTETVWHKKFGDFSRTSPVIVSEWGIGYFCNADTASSTMKLLQYLKNHGIGLEIGSWDWASAGFGSAKYDFPLDRTSSFQLPAGEQSCQPVPGRLIPYIPAGYGPGEMVSSWYQTGIPPTTIK